MASGFSACDCPPCRPGRAGTATGTCRLARVRRTMSRVSSPLAYPQVLRNLARLVTQQISLGDSKALIRRRLATREERFLRSVARYIYGSPRSPYLPLLAHAGAELGDLQTMVRQRGLDGTLERLRDEGVYFSFEEFKGRIDVVRGGGPPPLSGRGLEHPLPGADPGDPHRRDPQPGVSRGRGAGVHRRAARAQLSRHAGRDRRGADPAARLVPRLPLGRRPLRLAGPGGHGPTTAALVLHDRPPRAVGGDASPHAADGGALPGGAAGARCLGAAAPPPPLSRRDAGQHPLGA